MNRKNHVHLEGNLTRDPVLDKFLKTDSNTGEAKEVTVCRFTIACDGGRDGNSDECYFANIEAYDSAAERLSQFRKGDCLHVEGILRNKKWTDKKTGQDRHETVVRASHFICVFRKTEPALV